MGATRGVCVLVWALCGAVAPSGAFSPVQRVRTSLTTRWVQLTANESAHCAEIDRIVDEFYDQGDLGITEEEAARAYKDRPRDFRESIPHIDSKAYVKRQMIPNMVDLDNPKERYGDLRGIDDASDAPWRTKTQDVIRQAVAPFDGAELYDVSWNRDRLLISLDGQDGATVDSDTVSAVADGILGALEEHEDELQILARFTVEVTTKGVSNVLTTDKEFVAFRGFDVEVHTDAVEGMEARDPIVGKLVERTVMETSIMVKGRKVRIPNFLVTKVQLPEAKEETREGEAMASEEKGKGKGKAKGRSKNKK